MTSDGPIAEPVEEAVGELVGESRERGVRDELARRALVEVHPRSPIPPTPSVGRRVDYTQARPGAAASPGAEDVA